MPNVLMNGCHVVQEGTEAVVDAAQLTARLQVSSPVKEIGWLKIVKQFAIHAKVSITLSLIFRNLSYIDTQILLLIFHLRLLNDMFL